MCEGEGERQGEGRWTKLVVESMVKEGRERNESASVCVFVSDGVQKINKGIRE